MARSKSHPSLAKKFRPHIHLRSKLCFVRSKFVSQFWCQCEPKTFSTSDISEVGNFVCEVDNRILHWPEVFHLTYTWGQNFGYEVDVCKEILLLVFLQTVWPRMHLRLSFRGWGWQSYTAIGFSSARMKIIGNYFHGRLRSKTIYKIRKAMAKASK